MKAYAFDIAVGDDQPFTVGMIAEDMKTALLEFYSRYDDLELINKMNPTKRVHIPWRNGTVTRGKEVYKAKVAVGCGHLFWLKENGDHYVARCAVRYLPGGRVSCLIYRDNHDITFGG